METLALIGGSAAVIVLIAWGLRRSRRDIDELDQAEYRPPPVGGQAGPH